MADILITVNENDIAKLVVEKIASSMAHQYSADATDAKWGVRKGVKILSLFDGMACGAIAFTKMGLPIDRLQRFRKIMRLQNLYVCVTSAQKKLR